MRLMITGVNGFLGSSLAEMALNKGHSVLGVSRNDSNIKRLLSKLVFAKQQTSNYDSVKDVVREFSPDIVVHFAWNGGNSYLDINSLDQFSTNLPMLTSLLDLFSGDSKKPSFVGLGSFSEYGNFAIKATEQQIETPQNYYGLAKFHTKTMSSMFCELNEMRWSWIRPCYVYGEGDVKTRLIPRVINSLLSNKEIFLDDCTTIIDYIHIHDFTKGVIAVLENSSAHGVFNICSGREYVVRDVVQMISNKIVGDKELIRFGGQPSREDFPKHFSGSIQKITKTTGWKPEIEMSIGLDRTIMYFQKGLHNAKL